MDTAGGPDPKKARWSPNSFGATNGGNGGNTRDAFANYGYGPQSSLSQGQFNGTPSNGFGGALYSTPSLTINTNTGNNGMPSQLSPNPGGTSFAQQAQTPISANANSPYLGFGYNMLGMGLPGMNVLGTMGGFPYNNQMSNFQVKISLYCPLIPSACDLTPNQNRHSILLPPFRSLSGPPTLLPAAPFTSGTSLPPPQSTNFSISSTLAPSNRSAYSRRSLAFSSPSWTPLLPLSSMRMRSSRNCLCMGRS